MPMPSKSEQRCRKFIVSSNGVNATSDYCLAEHCPTFTVWVAYLKAPNAKACSRRYSRVTTPNELTDTSGSQHTTSRTSQTSIILESTRYRLLKLLSNITDANNVTRSTICYHKQSSISNFNVDPRFRSVPRVSIYY